MNLFRRKRYPLEISTRDIHNHILPGVDDGFRHGSHSLEALKTLVDAGVKDITFTPHMNPEVYPDMNESRLVEVYGNFVPRIPAEWGLKTSLAAEYMVVKDFEARAADPSLLTYPDGSVLIEMSYYYPSQNLDDTVFELNMAGRKPILAHPERYLYLADNLERFDRLAEAGCRFQLNYMSLAGTYGPDSMKILEHLLSHGMYSFVSSDLHTLHQLESILAIEMKKDIASRVNELAAGQSSLL